MWWIIGIAFAVLLAFSGTQMIRVAGLQADIAQEKQSRSDENSKRMSDALAFQGILDGVQRDHNEADRLKEMENAKREKALVAQMAIDTADNKRLRGTIDSYSANNRRDGESDAAFAKRSTDRLKVIGSLLAEGTGLLTEGLGIIGGRSVELENLLEQIRMDRAACQLRH